MHPPTSETYANGGPRIAHARGSQKWRARKTRLFKPIGQKAAPMPAPQGGCPAHEQTSRLCGASKEVEQPELVGVHARDTDSHPITWQAKDAYPQPGGDAQVHQTKEARMQRGEQ